MVSLESVTKTFRFERPYCINDNTFFYKKVFEGIRKEKVIKEAEEWKQKVQKNTFIDKVVTMDDSYNHSFEITILYARVN